MAPAGELAKVKPLVTLALVLTFCSYAAAECSVVVVSETKPSSRNAKITVLRDGKAQANVNLIVNLPERHGTWSFVTDSRGMAKLHHLPIGTSCITANADGGLQAGLCLDVSGKSLRGASLFTMSLSPGWPRLPSLEDELNAAQKTTPIERVSQLNGVVVDPAGAGIFNAEIAIYKHGSRPPNPLTKLKTNEEGQFAASLDPGTYTVVIQRPGFKTDLFVIEISPGNGEGKIQRILKIGQIC